MITETNILIEKKGDKIETTAKLESNIKKDKFHLTYNNNKWKEKITAPVPTLQLFITNKCNKRCKGCFYEENLGTDEISFDKYKNLILSYKDKIQKVILLGGEPTIHKELDKMIEFNIENNLKTTIYTNGKDLSRLENISNINFVETRIGILGLYRGEKNLAEIKSTKIPVTITYMLRKDNIDELMTTVKYAEENFNCKKFYISSIRDIITTKDYWIDTDETIELMEYGSIVQKFINEYEGNIPRIDISRRGILTTSFDLLYPEIDSCRFLNIFPDDKKIICPFDISKSIYHTTEKYEFNSRRCNKNDQCLLQKIVLERIK
ncbi:MAG: radical SAM protein [Candidatus Woesearchaeota archaeon]